MRYLRSALARMTGMFVGARYDDDLRAELESHLEMETAENIRRGMHPDEARRQARLASGGMTVAAEAVRSQRGIPWLESVGADVKYAARGLRHSPAFTAVVVLTLALGIGANTAIFSVVRGVLLKPLPHRDGDRLVYLRQSTDGPGGTSIAFSVPEVNDFRAGAPSLGGGIAEFSQWAMTIQEESGASRIGAGLVTGNFFEVMGLKPVLGRVTLPTDDGPGVEPVMVLTHDFWMQHFAGDPNIIGRKIRTGNGSITVVGVLQPAPTFPTKMDVLTNMVVSTHHLSAQMVQGRSHRMTEMVARLAPGATVDQAKREVAAAYESMQRDHKEAYDAGSHYRVAVIPFKEALGEKAKLTVWLLMAAAAFVLIISAANVVNLALMRGVRREPELMVRAALGAGVGRLRRLLLAENLLLTTMGAVFGIVIAAGGMRLLTALAARYSPRAAEIQLDFVVFGFTLALVVAIALLLSYAAFIPKEGTLSSIVSAGVRRITGGLRKQHLQRSLVVAQVAVSVVLLAGAGLLTRTLVHLSDVDTGLRTEQIIGTPVALLDISSGDFRRIMMQDAAAKQGYERMRAEAAALPGVKEAAIGSTLPLRSSGLWFDIKAEGREPVAGEATPRADFRTADPNYFSASGIPLLRGRAFDVTDGHGEARVAIINKTLADMLFPGQDPIGKRIAWTGEVLKFTPFSGEWRTVVGVVGNTQDGGLDAKPRGVAFVPFAGELALGGAIIVRADSNVAALGPALTRIVRRIAPSSPLIPPTTIAQYRSENVSPRRLNAALISSFGVLALVIAAVGIAGVLAFSVSARTTEIGIRMSLGADRGRVQRMILGEGGVLLALGLAIGVIGAWFATGVMRGLLFGVAPHDPVTFTGVAVTMGAIGLVACWIPALRAARIDPAISIRS